uniref:lamin tail domain-containing protein 1 n=1 Tax=Euleptes europaea TaxID=460621 RepID=UPI00253FF9BC|nr:lamin tail domain-containing protein 1 [Euleptes europaea]
MCIQTVSEKKESHFWELVSTDPISLLDTASKLYGKYLLQKLENWASFGDRFDHNFRQVISEEAGNSTAIEKLQSEHMDRQQHIKALEKRLEEVHDHLQTKLKALDAIQEKNASLQQEIDSLKRACGYIKGPCRTEATHCRLSLTLLQLQQNSEPKPTITSKPLEKVFYSRFMESQSVASLSPGELSSRVNRLPEISLSALDKILAPSCSYMLQNRCTVWPISSSLETNIPSQESIPYFFMKGRETPSLLSLIEKAEEKLARTEHFSSSACSAIGNLKIVELHPRGHYVKIINSSPNTEEDIGDYVLQQNVNGHPISTYKFSPRIRMKANSQIKVWAESSQMIHQPPTHFLWKNLDKFILGPECTTILCNPSGQAVAWYNPINRKQKQTLEGEEDVGLFDSLMQCSFLSHKPRDRWELKSHDTVQATDPQSPAEKKTESEFIIRREKTPPPLYPVQSPWCRSPYTPTHPHYSLERHFLLSTRSQSTQPDPDPDVPRTAHSQGRKVTSGSCNGKRRSTRSAGPNLGGVIYIGSAMPIGSALQKYFAHSSYHFRLLAQASHTPINFISCLTEDQ